MISKNVDWWSRVMWNQLMCIGSTATVLHSTDRSLKARSAQIASIYEIFTLCCTALKALSAKRWISGFSGFVWDFCKFPWFGQRKQTAKAPHKNPSDPGSENRAFRQTDPKYISISFRMSLLFCTQTVNTTSSRLFVFFHTHGIFFAGLWTIAIL